MRASIGFGRDDTPLAAHQIPLFMDFICGKLTRSADLFLDQSARTAFAHRSCDEK